MKAIIVLFVLSTLGFTKNTQDTTTIKATFDGFEEGVYYFTDADENSYYFDSVEESAMENYDLTNEQYIGQTFNVTYKIVTKTDEFDEEYDSFVILQLELVE